MNIILLISLLILFCTNLSLCSGDIKAKVKDALSEHLWLVHGKPRGFLPYSKNITYYRGINPPHRVKTILEPRMKYAKEPVRNCTQVFAKVTKPLSTADFCSKKMCMWKCVNVKGVREISHSLDVLWMDLEFEAMKYLGQISPNDELLGEGSRYDVLVGGGLGSITGETETVFVVDSGLDFNHRAFYSAVGSFPIQDAFDGENTAASTHPKIRAIFHDGNGATVASGSHGTAVASCAVGYNNDMGVSGIATGAKLAFMDISQDGSNLNPNVLTPVFARIMLEKGLGVGAEIMVHSYGSCPASGRYQSYSAEMDDFVYDNPYVSNFVSAGNSAATCTSTRGIGDPATAKNVISVGASFSEPSYYAFVGYPSTTLLTSTSVADFSSVGPLQDGRRAPTVYGPGVFEQVAYGITGGGNPDSQQMNLASGTSFSAPLVAGAAAVLKNWYRVNKGGENMYASTVKAALIVRSQEMQRLVSTSTGSELSQNDAFGFGTPTLGNLDELSFVNGETLSEGSRWSVCIKSVNTVSLVWTDVAAASGSTSTLVNDFNMFVFGLDGVRLNTHDEKNPQEVFRNTMNREWVRVVVIAEDLFPSSDRFSLVHDGDDGNVTCAGSCLPGEVQECNSGRGLQACNPDTGNFDLPCRVRGCDAGWGGKDCQEATSLTPCVLNGAEGELNVFNSCFVVRCTEGENLVFDSDSSCGCVFSSVRYLSDGTETLDACTLSTLSPVVSGSPPISSIKSDGTRMHVTFVSFFVYICYLYLLM